MIRIVRMATAAALLASAMPAAAAKPSFESLPARPTPDQACANLRQAKFRWNDPAVADPARLDAAHDQIRGRYGGGSPEASRVLRMLIGGGMGAEGLVGPESVVAWRGEDGLWKASRVYEATRPPAPPEYPVPPLWPEPEGSVERPGIVDPTDSERDVYEGAFGTEASAAIDAMLAAPCFAREPGAMPMELKLRGGGKEYCVPDSASWSLEIREGGRSRLYGRPCRLLGPVGAVIGLLQGAPLRKVNGPVVRADLYTADPDPTVEKLHAFLAARLPGQRFASPELASGAAILSYKPTGKCEGEIVGRLDDGSEVTLRRRWSDLRAFETWPDGASVKLYFEGKEETMTFPGTVAALKAEGATAWIATLCALAKEAPHP